MEDGSFVVSFASRCFMWFGLHTYLGKLTLLVTKLSHEMTSVLAVARAILSSACSIFAELLYLSGLAQVKTRCAPATSRYRVIVVEDGGHW